MGKGTGRLDRLRNDPWGVGRRLWRRLLGKEGDYQPADYWSERHRAFRFDARGVGQIDDSTEDNERWIAESNRTMKETWGDCAVAFETASVLDIGCGQGHHARNFAEMGGRHYTGVDITDVLFPDLRAEFPDFRFQRLDVATEPLTDTFDVIVMVNVIEHIVEDARFRFAMANVRDHLTPEGIFITTVPCDPPPTHPSPHWRHWPLSELLTQFPGFRAGPPRPFWNKSLVVLDRTP